MAEFRQQAILHKQVAHLAPTPDFLVTLEKALYENNVERERYLTEWKELQLAVNAAGASAIEWRKKFEESQDENRILRNHVASLQLSRDTLIGQHAEYNEKIRAQHEHELAEMREPYETGKRHIIRLEDLVEQQQKLLSAACVHVGEYDRL